MKVNLIKIILIAFGFSMLYALTQINSDINNTFTDATISITNLSEENYQYIKKDLTKTRGISFCDVSLITNIISLKMNDNIISENNIKTIFCHRLCIIIKIFII